ncbi:MAG: hypothetical protein M3540_14015 [Actinomycetota bacterium]|nr:hypothetical protein [Actinomycetota bacterium]
MAPKKRTPEQIQQELATEREALTTAVGDLREATDFGGKLKAKLPVAAAGALGAGFFLAGGIGATVRLLFRRGRE